MGCSPSKGKLFSKPEGPVPQKALLAEASQDSVDSRPVEEDKNDDKENELPSPTEDHSTRETTWSQVASDTKAAQSAEDIKEMEENVIPQEIVKEVVQTDKVKKTEKRKKNKDKRRSTQKQRKSSIIQTKVDFPPHMVRAHQAAYAFLNPNIAKYETLLGLLDQAAQTQLSLQPMMSALVLRFEEINQALEEMAEEGELMLKEHGDYMALPSGMLGPAVMPAKPSTDTTNPLDPPPDLLQQLLQHSTEKMKLVGGSAQALGDTTLEEAAEYFSSLSKLLVVKLQAKQAVEQRLSQVLARVEGAAMRKSNPEDSALHSEDSGIGGENESLAGSERHRRHRGSAGSGSCGSGVNIRGALDNSPNLVGHNEDDEEDEEDDDDDDEEYEDDEEDGHGRKRSNSSPPDPSRPLLYMRAKYMQDLQPTLKRPLTAVTATKPEPSTKSVNIVMELQKSQRDLDRRMKKMYEIRGNKELAGPHYNLYRAGLRRHSLSGSASAQKGPFKTSKSPSFLPMLAPQPPKRQSVRRLINSFSQGVDGRPGQTLANIPPHIRRPRKSGLLPLSDIGNSNEGGLVINGNNNNNSWPDGRDDLDVDNLPPPPPEVLMDNSFQSTEGMPENEEGSQEESAQSLPMINQKTGVSQRLRASVQNVEVLPNRVSMRPRTISIASSRPVRQDAVMGAQDAEQQPETDLDPEMEKANCLYQQARKIIHLRNAAESSDKRNIAEQSSRGPSSIQARMGQRFESSELYEGEQSLPVTAPPVSRVRLPPSCPSVRHRFPSPPVFRSQSNSRPSSRPSSPRTVTRATENNTEEIIPSVSFHDARSVFCQKETSGSSVLPRPCGEASRGRLTTRGIDNTTRRTQSEQRPSVTSHLEFSKDGNSTSTQAKQGEFGETKQRPVSPLMTEDNTQLDPSATAMTA
ncbi:photoreceptor cilium actin regulator [Thunnus albacares]|uniref:photoreceptor cilium actin regulator n=1 Tax=Thunnus albacares TaxID=8236 RepID=UPI001CF624ED|nr:photoreceptor cilium actin regulator [Thunnus albacares]